MVRLWLSVVLAFGCELPQASRVALRGELEVALATGPVRLGPIESLDRGQRYFLALTTIDPSFEARAELEVAGITLGPRVEPRLWWMELAPNADLSLAATVVEAAGVVPPERKIDRSIGDGGLVFVLSHEPIPNATRGLLEGWYEARLSRAAIEELATRPAVRFIASAEDTSTSRPLADAVRARIGVEEVQGFRVVDEVPTYRYSGRGVVAGVFDVGFVYPHPDFGDRLTEPFAGESSHPTGAAGMMAGDGSWSEARGAAPYAWRGMAPGAGIISRSGVFQSVTNEAFTNAVLNQGMVLSNTSLAAMSQGGYTAQSALIDAVARGAVGRPHTSVGAAANNGNGAQYGTVRGYYSTLYNAKNALVTGLAFTNYPSRDDLSSMGPTHDGRLSPQVMAPTVTLHWPPDGREIAIDWIRFEDASGAVIRALEFDDPSEADGWRSAQLTRDLRVEAGALRFLSRFVGIVVSPDGLEVSGATVVRWRMSVGGGVSMRSNWQSMQWGTSRYCDPECNVWTREAGGRGLGVNADGEMHEYDAAIETTETIQFLRVVPHWGGDEGATVAAYDEREEEWTYGEFGGTSSAAPVATGVAALLLEALGDATDRDLELEPFRPATVRAILMETADDMVYETAAVMDRNNPDTGEPVTFGPGPDFATGFGMLDAVGAIALAEEGRYHEDHVAEGSTRRYEIVLAEPASELSITLAWDDPPADPMSEPRAPKLVHDLDLRVVGPSGTLHRPLVVPIPPAEEIADGDLGSLRGIDPIRPGDLRPAIEGVDRLDNFERVRIAPAGPGRYAIEVVGADSFAEAPQQSFSLAASAPIAAPRFCVPHPELCDGRDDDCDARADEGLATNDERCDFYDDDCDGFVDEGCACHVDRACALRGYTCERGVQRCVDGAWPAACEPPRGCERTDLPVDAGGPDAGPVAPDAAMPDAGVVPVQPDPGCGCTTAAPGSSIAWWLAVALVFVRLRRSRTRDEIGRPRRPVSS
jgi:MYXO-CTERM domain-containing protein